MTLSDDIKADVDDVFLNTDDFAESILRYLNGNVSDASAVVAVVTWTPTNTDHDGGRMTRRTGEVLVNDDSARRPFTVQDAFLIEGQRAEVTAVDPVQDGAQVIHVVQVLKESKGAEPVRTGAF